MCVCGAGGSAGGCPVYVTQQTRAGVDCGKLRASDARLYTKTGQFRHLTWFRETFFFLPPSRLSLFGCAHHNNIHNSPPLPTVRSAA